MEIGWTYTMFWEASALACKVTAFFRALGFYLSGFVIMVISIDRLLAVIHPLEHRCILLRFGFPSPKAKVIIQDE